MQQTDNHRIYASCLHDDAVEGIVCMGPAGTGKTFNAVKAFVKARRDKKNTRLVMMRPNVPFMDSLGLLRGGLEEKLGPWMRPLMDIFKELGVKAEDVEKWVAEGHLEAIAVEHVQGLTFHDAMVVVDEVENLTYFQIKMIMERMGQNSKLVMMGDVAQTSPKVRNGGLGEIVEMIKATGHPTKVIEMGKGDRMRSPYSAATMDCDELWQAMKEEAK